MPHHLKIYLDNRRAGHAYLELLPPGEEKGEVYGYYPALKGEKKEVLFGKGQIRKDRERLEDVRADADDQQIVKSVELEQEQYDALCAFVEEQTEKPPFYFLLGYNCVEFTQDAYTAARGEKAGHFLELYSEEELDTLGYLGFYAELRKKTGGAE